MTTLSLFTNRATAKLAADASAVDTALTLVPNGGEWFPSPGPGQFFRLVLQKGTSQQDQREYMICTSRTGDVLTVTRAQEGTPAANFLSGDEVSLVATGLTMTSFVQRAGATLQGALEVEADPVTPLGIATKSFVESGRVNDAPADGKDYARKDLAWHALGAAAGLAVPIPVTAGGTGGITVAVAQTNLGISKTTFDDLAPATPNYGDRWIRPSSMTEMVWVPNAGGGGAGVWINPADAASEAYPIPVSKGGTGATTAPAALVNLGIPNHERLQVSADSRDITLNYFAAGAAAGNVSLGLFKTTTGLASVYGYGGTPGAPQPRWGVTMGDGAAESTGNAGSNFAIARFADNGVFIDSPLSISRASGLVQMTGGALLAKLLLGDGAIATPSLTFASEPGLGWYRLGTSIFGTVAGGALTSYLSASSATSTAFSMTPRTAGNTVMYLANQPNGAANANVFVISTQPGNYALSESLTGTAVALPMIFSFAGGVRFSDGSRAIPNIAFASEPGLGWYRSGAGGRAFAVGGQGVETLGMAGSGQYLSYFPTVNNGSTQLTLHDNQQQTAAQHQFFFTNQSSSYRIGEFLTGGATGNRTLVLEFPAGVQANANAFILQPNAGSDAVIYLRKNATANGNLIIGTTAGVTRWAMYLGNSGDNFALSRFNASGSYLDDPLGVSTAGNVSLGATANPWYFDTVNGYMILPPNTGQVANGNGGLMQAVSGTGFANWNQADGKPMFQTSSAAGDKAIWWLRHAVNGVGYPVAIGVYGNSNFAADFIRHYVNGNFYDFDGAVACNAIKNAGSPSWAVSSDDRLKENIRPYAKGLAEIIRVEPVTFNRRGKAARDVERGVLAQRVAVPFPEAVFPMDNHDGRYSDLPVDQVLMFDAWPLTLALINAVKTLNQRLTQLENA